MKKGRELTQKDKQDQEIPHDATPREVKSLLENEISDPDHPLFIYKGWCKKCGICIEFCPRKVYERGEDGYPVVAQPDNCTNCRLCEYRCPDFAITVLKSRK